jgi:hypothetical protein
MVFHDFQSRLSRERRKVKIWTLFRWNRLASLGRIHLVRILRVPFQITIRKHLLEKRGYFGAVELDIAC